MLRVVFVCLIALLLASPAFAQSTPPDGCTPDDYLDLIYESSAEIDRSADLNFAIDTLITNLMTQRARCGNTMFSGPGNNVVGPLDLDAGTWVMGVRFSGQGMATVQSVTGECASAVSLAILMALGPQGGEDYAILSLPTDCRLLIDLSTASPWQMFFRPTQ